MQGRTGQVRYCGLKGVKAIAEWQQRVLAEGDDDRLVLDRKHCRLRFLRPGLQISDAAALLPLGNCLWNDALSFGKAPQALLTMLYRSTDRLCRCGANIWPPAYAQFTIFFAERLPTTIR